MQTTLESLQSSLAAGPDLLSLPKDVRDLQSQVASFGSNLALLEGKVTDAKTTQADSEAKWKQTIDTIEVCSYSDFKYMCSFEIICFSVVFRRRTCSF